jgi:hypothetical protein
MGKKLTHPTVSDPVGVPEMAGTPESFSRPDRKSGNFAKPNIYCAGGVCKGKKATKMLKNHKIL